VGAFLYRIVRRWLPARPVSAAVIALGFGMLLVVRANEEDFTFLGLAVSLSTFVVVLAAYGAAIALLLDHVAPPVAGRSVLGRTAAFGVIGAAVLAGGVAFERAVALAT
jgi:hypothetical protein